MELVDLGPLRVSRLCLGTMLMGGRTPPDEAQLLLDAWVAAGHNFIDTADVYGDGTSEQTLAPWLARRRDEVVVATKVRFGVSDPGGSGLAPERIVRACDASHALTTRSGASPEPPGSETAKRSLVATTTSSRRRASHGASVRSEAPSP